MSIFDKYVKMDSFNEKGLMVKPEIGDVQYFSLEELYQSFKERYDREKDECKN